MSLNTAVAMVINLPGTCFINSDATLPGPFAFPFFKDFIAVSPSSLCIMI
jgi:hypothetical protein